MIADLLSHCIGVQVMKGILPKEIILVLEIFLIHIPLIVFNMYLTHCPKLFGWKFKRVVSFMYKILTLR